LYPPISDLVCVTKKAKRKLNGSCGKNSFRVGSITRTMGNKKKTPGGEKTDIEEQKTKPRKGRTGNRGYGTLRNNAEHKRGVEKRERKRTSWKIKKGGASIYRKKGTKIAGPEDDNPERRKGGGVRCTIRDSRKRGGKNRGITFHHKSQTTGYTR